MAWVVDTCVLIDVLEDDPEFGIASAETLDAHSDEGLIVCPVSYAELAPSFQGDRALQDEFLSGVGVDFRHEWSWEDTLRAHEGWHEFIQMKKAGKLPKRPLADILIGACASRFQGLVTRNPADFERIFPDLTLRLPAGSSSS
jgi:predicted nucleic acid-binding protein